MMTNLTPQNGGGVCSRHNCSALKSMLGLMALCGMTAAGQSQIASDQGANYTLGWTNGANAGSGFSPWTFNNTQGSGSAGGFIGNPDAAGISGMSTESFGFFANPIASGATAEASRSFGAALETGQTFSFQLGLNFDSDSATSNRGFNLFSGGTQIININMGNSSEIAINDSPMFSVYGTQAFTLNFEQISPTSLRVFGTGRDGSEVYDNTFIGLAGAASSFSLYFNATEGIDERQMYFNNLNIVPEPSVISLLVVGMAGMLFLARRKNRVGTGG